MFGQFKEKLQLVQHDLSASFKSLTTKAREVGIGKRVTTDFNECLPDSPIKIKLCRYEAGAELLNKFQSSWVEVHNDIETSASRATAVDARLHGVLQGYEKRTESLHQLHKHLQDLPTMMQDIQKMTVTVGRLEAFFEELECMIINFEDLVETEEFKMNQINKQKELQKYKTQKDIEYARTKAHLQAENEQMFKEFEKAEEAKMKERQQAFEEVFTAEMDHYKQHGKVNEKVVSRDKKSTSSIDDFELQVDDSDRMALDDFLGADITTTTRVSGKIQERDENDEEEDDTKPTKHEEISNEKTHQKEKDETNQGKEEHDEQSILGHDEENVTHEKNELIIEEKNDKRLSDSEEKTEEENSRIEEAEGMDVEHEGDGNGNECETDQSTN
ncbi:dysbindin-like [Anneissia japonica]|uniref:dysbindin-like n=1 Tax=Anneissia japonica TaxID=1529436 RepID=UPI0014255CC4|nr:dysbindin-like [Anneissia japonica]XP_033117327.1 dysbindin-like [Anneissia japonica]XP_033117328.1 dysbindin-like [Anneissia japonica]XP_033117329.1 dysbindin-like [Anneissia japonica]